MEPAFDTEDFALVVAELEDALFSPFGLAGQGVVGAGAQSASEGHSSYHMVDYVFVETV